MIVSSSRNFIFVHIHKTGGNSVTEALRPSLTRSDWVLDHDLGDWARKWGRARHRVELATLRKHSPAATIAAVLPPEVWDGSFKFAFVRHPIARTLSLYNYAVGKLEERRRFLPRNAWYLTPPGKGSDPLQWRSVQAVLDAGSFSGFIRHPLLEPDASMSSQWSLLTDESGKLIIDFIGRFEHLEADFNRVQDRLGLPRSALGWRNASPKTAHSRVSISDEDREFLTQRFRADFDMFAYDPLQNG